MRKLLVFLAGLAAGVILTVVVMDVGVQRYAYFTLPPDECHLIRQTAEVVPHQPNPCHFRRPRWDFLP